MIRVLLLNERDPLHPRAGGAETHVAEIFGRLARAGFEVNLASCSFDAAPRRAEVSGMHVERLGRVPSYYARAAWACARDTRRGRYDVVVECLNKLPFLAPLYSAVPTLGLCHHLFGGTAFRQVAWPLAATVWCAERLVPRVYRGERLVAISDSTRDDLVRRGVNPDRIEVHLPGIRRPDIEPIPILRREPRIAYVGRLERYKNVDVLLRAVAGLAGRFPALRLDIVGRGSDRARLEALARELGITERTAFRGFVADAERDRLLACARVCVCPSSKEGWGLTVIESNAVGTPNVASDAPGLRDSVRDGETGFLVAERDVAALADRIAALLGDDALAERMSAAAVAWSQRFDWGRAADQMRATLEAAVACGRSR
ncbi:MAG: glycosyltransferase family 4 protein [Myxococcales bacterium]|nr:glycosyltransferase family 4 protein [Myxococcales bacterium]